MCKGRTEAQWIPLWTPRHHLAPQRLPTLSMDSPTASFDRHHRLPSSLSTPPPRPSPCATGTLPRLQLGAAPSTDQIRPLPAPSLTLPPTAAPIPAPLPHRPVPQPHRLNTGAPPVAPQQPALDIPFAIPPTSRSRHPLRYSTRRQQGEHVALQPPHRCYPACSWMDFGKDEGSGTRSVIRC